MIKVGNYELHWAEHMLPKNNLQNVLKNGLLSHNEAYGKKLIVEDISMKEVQDRRKEKDVPVHDNKTINLHDLVSFYFNTRNPMMYVRKDKKEDLLIILISIDIISNKPTDDFFAVFSDGNAGSYSTNFFLGKEKLSEIDLHQILSGSWNDKDEVIKREKKRICCAEVLVYPRVPVTMIKHIVCPTEEMKRYAQTLLDKEGITHIKLHVKPEFYF
jgi:hypothetical protein